MDLRSIVLGLLMGVALSLVFSPALPGFAPDAPSAAASASALPRALGGGSFPSLAALLGGPESPPPTPAPVPPTPPASSADPSALSPAASCVRAEPLFSPGSGDEIRALIASARASIEVEMYVLSDPDLAQALAEAARRGVRVRVILEPRIDSSNADALAAALAAGGAEVRWASLSFALTHSKMLIVDGERVLVGSINFSRSAQGRNREAAVVLSGPGAARAYSEVFEQDWPEASALRPKPAS